MLQKRPIDYFNSNPFKNATVLSARHAGATCPTAPHIRMKISRHGKGLSSFFFLSFLPQARPKGRQEDCSASLLSSWNTRVRSGVAGAGRRRRQVTANKNNDTCSRDGFCGTRDNDLDASVCVLSLGSHGWVYI